ncbi:MULTISPECIES: hypothetical protein [Marinobacter]|nr:hypothetical protein [Marinobacter sp. Arc7-DN-1]
MTMTNEVVFLLDVDRLLDNITRDLLDRVASKIEVLTKARQT